MNLAQRLQLAFATIAWVALAANALGAASGTVGRPIEPTLEDAMLADAADGKIEQFSLLEAALIAEGVTDQQLLTRYCRQVDKLVAWSPSTSASSQPPVEGIYGLLHRDLLIGSYRDDCSRLAETLECGDYNCLTATILFQCLCRRVGIEAIPIAAPGHVYSRIAAPQPLTIQTTCPDWFQRGPAPAAGTDVAERQLDDAGLIAKVYYNRGLSRYREDDYEVAQALLERALQLDPSDRAAADNLLAVINNWALAESAAGRHENALDLLAAGEHRGRDYDRFRVNRLHVYGRWVQQLCKDEKFAQALAVLQAGRRDFPDADLFTKGHKAVQAARNKSLARSPNAAALSP